MPARRREPVWKRVGTTAVHREPTSVKQHLTLCCWQQKLHATTFSHPQRNTASLITHRIFRFVTGLASCAHGEHAELKIATATTTFAPINSMPPPWTGARVSPLSNILYGVGPLKFNWHKEVIDVGLTVHHFTNAPKNTRNLTAVIQHKVSAALWLSFLCPSCTYLKSAFVTLLRKSESGTITWRLTRSSFTCAHKPLIYNGD